MIDLAQRQHRRHPDALWIPVVGVLVYALLFAAFVIGQL